MAKLASLIVDLQLQSAQLRQGLDEANRKLDAFGQQAERTANLLEGVFTFDALKDGLAALGSFVAGGAEAVGAMSNLAKAAGTPVEEFSKLAYAAERFGFESDNLSESFAQLSEYMAEAKGGSTEHAALFKGLGVAYEDAGGKLRSTGDVFADLAQRFSETSDGAAKTALAVKFFGEEGIKLIPMLNQGKAGLAALGDEAARTGNVITEQGAASAAEFNAALSRLTKAGEGLAAAVAQELAPSMAAFAKEATTGTASTEAFQTAATALAAALRVVASTGVMVAGAFDFVGKAAAGAAAWTVALFDDDAIGTRSGEAGRAMGEALSASLKDEGKKLRAIWDTTGPGALMSEDAKKSKPAADEHLAAIARTKKAAEDAAAAQKKAADRVAESQKKLAEAAKKAAEESAKALEEYVRSALSLERQHAAIDRAAAKRMNFSAPTEGFSSADGALSTMTEAQKSSASMRARASELEKDGDIIGADKAARLADEMDALAERASGAVDAFRDMEATAIDTALWLDQHAAELGNRLGDIDREVDARRAALSNAVVDPAGGFSSFNAALDAMGAALKHEASLRSEAAALEREGRLGEARQALLAAEATKALAEQSSAAADALAEMDRARANVPGELGGMLTGGIGGTTSAMVEGVKTGAAAGPVGAVVGGLVGLLSQSETFQGALDSLEEIFQKLADSVGRLIEPLLPLLDVVAAVAEGLGALLEVLSPIIEFVARPLFEVFKGFGLVVLGLVKFIGEIIDGIAKTFGGKGVDLSGISEAMNTLENSSYDAARGNDKVAETANEAAGGLNTVSWWRESLARFEATENGRTGGSGSGGGGTTIHDNSQTTIEVRGVTNPEEVAERVRERVVGRNNRRSGNRGPGEVP